MPADPHGHHGPNGGQYKKSKGTPSSRKGFHTKIIEKIDTEVIGNKVLSKATVPYVRAGTITFKGYGLLPNTQVYPFFDRRSVAAYVTPSAGFSTSGASLVKGDALITNSNGEIQGTFEIPDPKVKGNPVFKTGDVPFRLTSSPSNKQKPMPVTASETLYHATGILRTTQATIRATRNAKVVRTAVTQTTISKHPYKQGNGGGFGGKDAPDKGNTDTAGGNPSPGTFGGLGGADSGGAGADPGGCFARGTPFLMADGSYKSVENICVGDEIYGGIVYGIKSGMSNRDWYSYKGVHVDDEHFVLENNAWMYVKDSSIATPIEPLNMFYTLNTTNHRLYSINNTIFTDDAVFDHNHHIWNIEKEQWNEMLNVLNDKSSYEIHPHQKIDEVA